MPVISNQKNPAAVALGRLGGRAGRGEAKRRSRATYDKMVAAKKERRDCALEVLGALIEAEAVLRAAMGSGALNERALLPHLAQQRAARAIERATGTKPGVVK